MPFERLLTLNEPRPPPSTPMSLCPRDHGGAWWREAMWLLGLSLLRGHPEHRSQSSRPALPAHCFLRFFRVHPPLE